MMTSECSGLDSNYIRALLGVEQAWDGPWGGVAVSAIRVGLGIAVSIASQSFFWKHFQSAMRYRHTFITLSKQNISARKNALTLHLSTDTFLSI
jgi:hypothetical protein